MYFRMRDPSEIKESKNDRGSPTHIPRGSTSEETVDVRRRDVDEKINQHIFGHLNGTVAKIDAGADEAEVVTQFLAKVAR